MLLNKLIPSKIFLRNNLLTSLTNAKSKYYNSTQIVIRILMLTNSTLGKLVKRIYKISWPFKKIKNESKLISI